MGGLATVEEVGDETVPTGGEPLYERDFARWALREAEILRAGRLDEVDLDNLAEEIESLGREQFGKVRSAIRIIILHMLKWDYQPERRTRSWALSIRNRRSALEDRIELSPSLRGRRHEAIESAYPRARLGAADETGLRLSTFPTECPYALDDILTRPFEWPDE